MYCSKGVSEGFLYKVLGFPRVPWVSCTVASVFEPESKERVVFLRGFPRVSHGFPKGFPGFLRFPPRFEKWLIKAASLLNVTFLKSIASGRLVHDFAGLNNLVPLAAPQAPKSVYRPEDAAVSHCHTSNHC